MTLKEFKIALIRHARTLIPNEYYKVLRVPGTASSDELILRTKGDSKTKNFCVACFDTSSKSFKINRSEVILGEQIIESFNLSSERNNEEISDIFNVNEVEFLALEKSRVAHNLEIAFNNPKSEIFEFMELAKKSGLVEEIESNLPELLRQFQATWPIEKLKSMTLEEYTNLEKTSFCYWVEAKTYSLGSIWGGSSYKFGIFERKDLEADNYNEKRKSDGKYAWYGKYGDNKEEVFEKLKSIIVQIATLSQENLLEEIDTIDLGDAYKWKIAFLYSDYNIINIFNQKALIASANYLGYGGSSKKYSELNKYILSQQGDKDFFEFSKELWALFSKDDSREKEFEKWLNETLLLESGKIKYYIYAIRVLKKHFEIPVYQEDSIEVLEDLYEDLKLNQKDVDGKFFYKKAPSYGADGYYSAAIGTYINFFKSINQIVNHNIMEKSQPLNQILFGPPGTGKTYHTINKALSIIENKPEDIIYNESRSELNKRFDEYVNSGQIVFTTFHQSMSYEDFVEGIKPEVLKDGSLNYKTIPGIFSEICERARVYSGKESQNNKPLSFLTKELMSASRFYKISLGENNTDEGDNVSSYCLDNDMISMGYGGDYDYSKITLANFFNFISDKKDLSSNDISNIRRFKYELKEGDIVFVSKGFYKSVAVGIIEGEYFYDSESECEYNHFRKVKWLSKEEIPVSFFYSKQFVQGTLYNLKRGQFLLDDFSSHSLNNELVKKNLVLIIDEINRANVSSVFGELITLLEESKREGSEESITLKLPYSKSDFSVPSNLYVLGTMNTADRSVEALDTALRRRFSFSEMLPDPHLLKPELMLARFWVKYEDQYGENEKSYEEFESGIRELLGFVINDYKLYMHVGDVEYLLLKENIKKLGLRLKEVVKFEGVNLEDLLITINKRIEVLVDRDHTIGHAFFMNVESLKDLKDVFADKIIPLLQEYFYGDYSKIELVLGAGFFEPKKEVSSVAFAVDADISFEGNVYHLKNVSKMSSVEFEDALKGIKF